jgi:hypothetical protein
MPSVIAKPSRSFGGASVIGRPSGLPTMSFGFLTAALPLTVGLEQRQMDRINVARLAEYARLGLVDDAERRDHRWMVLGLT